MDTKEKYNERIKKCLKHIDDMYLDNEMRFIITKSEYDDDIMVKSKVSFDMKKDIQNFDNTIIAEYVPECPTCDKKLKYEQTVEDFYGEWQCYFCESCGYKCKVPMHKGVNWR